MLQELKPKWFIIWTEMEFPFIKLNTIVVFFIVLQELSELGF